MIRRLAQYVPDVPGITSSRQPQTQTPAEDIVLLRTKSKLRNIAILLSCVWISGAVGGLAFWLIGPLFDVLRIFDVAKVDLHNHFELSWDTLYQSVFWGGLWGLLFLLMLPKGLYSREQGRGIGLFFARALIYGLVPAAIAAFVVLPKDGDGYGGLELGAATPVFVLLFATLGWSIPAYAWLNFILPEEAEPTQLYESLLGTEGHV